MLVNNAIELEGEEPLTVSLLPGLILECLMQGVCILYCFIEVRFVLQSCFPGCFCWPQYQMRGKLGINLVV